MFLFCLLSNRKEPEKCQHSFIPSRDTKTPKALGNYGSILVLVFFNLYGTQARVLTALNTQTTLFFQSNLPRVQNISKFNLSEVSRD